MTEIAREPLRTSIAAETNGHRLRQLREGAVTLEPKHSPRAFVQFGFSILLLGLPICATLWAASVETPLLIGAVVVFGTLIAICLGVALFHPLQAKVVFDREAGSATFRGVRLGKTSNLPLAKILAVQLCGPIEHPDFERTQWRSYQLNLALAPGAAKKDRLNLLDNGGLDELMFIAWKLAEFLDVPFLDHRTSEEHLSKDAQE